MDSNDGPAEVGARAEKPLELDWDEISEPGCYLLISSGLLARIYLDEARARAARPRSRAGARAARLSPDPGEPLQHLRTIAEMHHYPVKF